MSLFECPAGANFFRAGFERRGVKLRVQHHRHRREPVVAQRLKHHSTPHRREFGFEQHQVDLELSNRLRDQQRVIEGVNLETSFFEFEAGGSQHFAIFIDHQHPPLRWHDGFWPGAVDAASAPRRRRWP